MPTKRYYKPSNDEVKLELQIIDKLKDICEKDKDINIEFANIRFAGKDYSYYEKLREGKEVVAIINNSKNKKATITILVEKGLLVYYKINKKATYVAKLKEIANASFNIKAGEYVLETTKEVDDEPEGRAPINWDERIGCTPDEENNNIQDTEESCYDENDKFWDWYERHEYCKQYREMFGTDSTEVSEEYF